MDIAALDTSFNKLSSVTPSLFKGTEAGGSPSTAGETLNQFGDLLKDQINKISELDTTARAGVEDYATGGNQPLHQVIMNIEKADTALQVATQIRNKMLMAYQEVSRMQI
jgi:flagellar hook-basal body complex protein FliE